MLLQSDSRRQEEMLATILVNKPATIKFPGLLRDLTIVS